MTNDEKYMWRAIQLAKCGEASVYPNPMVGAVIVYKDIIIGEGYHQKCGGPHAEVNAVRSVHTENKQYLAESTIYVTLEPCSHWGKTPPCCDMLIANGFRRVVIGMQDPNAKVNGEGIRRMREAGIDVLVGVLEKECRAVNPDFYTYHSLGRPRVTLKWAQTTDGTIGVSAESCERLRISTQYTEMMVHRLRSRCQAIMVGTDTVLQDNPSLTTRLWRGRSPLRVTIDRRGRFKDSLRVFGDGMETLVYHNEILPEILYDLHKRGVQHLLVEGGGKLLQSFIDSNLWDEARVEISSRKNDLVASLPCGQKVKAPVLRNAEIGSEYTLDGNKLLILLNSKRI